MISRRSVKYYRSGIIAAWLAAVALTVSLAGCSAVTEPERPCPDDPGADAPTLGLSFQVSTAVPVSRSHAASRTDDSGHPEEGSDYTIEDEINLNDFGFFIFAGSADDADADLRLLYKNTAVTQTASEMSMTGSLGDYTVNLDLPHTTVEHLLGATAGDESLLSPGGSRKLKLRIAIIANSNASRLLPGLKGFDGLSQVYNDADPDNASPFADFTTIAEGLRYTMPAATGLYANLQIPMYGLSDEITLTESAMYWSRPDERLILGEISLLRAMAKLRLVDAIAPELKTDGYPRLVSASVTYGIKGGYVTPETPGAYKNGQQVHTDRTGEAATGTPIAMLAGTVVASSLITYLPAQSLLTGAPTLSVEMQRDAGSQPQTFTVDLSDAEYTTIVNDWLPLMLRNHVYTLAITNVVFGTTLELTATVADWEEEVFNLDYSNTVNTTNDGKIDWVAGTFQSETTTEDGHGTLIVSPWHIPDGETHSKPVDAELTFGLASPVGAFWTASLLNVEGNPAAFMFVDADGNEKATIEGRIDGKQQRLKIRPMVEEPTVNSRVRLQIIVSIGGGQQFVDATVPTILGDWIIVQPQQ